MNKILEFHKQLESDNYHHMAVAYGLSFSADDIKEIILSHVVAEDIIAEMRDEW